MGRSLAADLTKIDRAIRKEPAYKSKEPRYCLLVFGPAADYRVWLVLDGDTLYVDRNGNGDLTEAGESTGRQSDRTPTRAASSRSPFWRRTARPRKKLTFALFGWFDYREGKAGRISPSCVSLVERPVVRIVGRRDRAVRLGTEAPGCPRAARRRSAADGVRVRAEHALKRKGDGEYELSVGVGTKGLGKGAFVHLSYAKDAIPKDVYPTAILEFPNKTPGGPPVRVRGGLEETVLKLPLTRHRACRGWGGNGDGQDHAGVRRLEGGKGQAGDV